MFAICQMITGATLCCIFILCVQNRLLRFGLQSYNRHTSCVTKYFIEKMWGLETSAGCPASSASFGWSSSQPGSCLSSSFSSHLSPSCGTCGGGRSLVNCAVVMVGKQEGLMENCHKVIKWPERDEYPMIAANFDKSRVR